MLSNSRKKYPRDIINYYVISERASEKKRLDNGAVVKRAEHDFFMLLVCAHNEMRMKQQKKSIYDVPLSGSRLAETSH